jgi:hypothetical protein
MRVTRLLNSLLLVGFLAVIAATVVMITRTGYNDKVSHTCFILHATNGFLLLARAAFSSDEPSSVS